MVFFGKIFIIYEFCLDVIIEVVVIVFKVGNKIWLKGGKEVLYINILLVEFWYSVLEIEGVDIGYVNYLNLDCVVIQKFIKDNFYCFDFIILCGGECLIVFVWEYSNILVIVSGWGNNFFYVGVLVDYDMVLFIIKNGKSWISVCNVLDKVLIDWGWLELEDKFQYFSSVFFEVGLEVIVDQDGWVGCYDVLQLVLEVMWYEEFLLYCIVFKVVDSMEQGIIFMN